MDGDFSEGLNRSIGMAKQFKWVGCRHRDYFHTRAPRRLDSKKSIFENNASLRRDTQKFSCLEKDIRRRLAIDDIFCRNDHIEEFAKPRGSKDRIKVDARCR